MNRSKPKELLLLLALCCIPLAALFIRTLRQEQAASAIQRVVVAKFKPVVDAVSVVQVPNRSNDPYEATYLVTIYFGHRGQRPTWWGHKSGIVESGDYPAGRYIMSSGLGASTENPRFKDQKGRRVESGGLAVFSGMYAPANQKYIIHVQLGVPKSFVVKGSRFLADVRTNYGPLRVDWPIHEVGGSSGIAKPTKAVKRNGAKNN